MQHFEPIPEDRVWALPPIILHPFADPDGPDQLVESSRAHLMLEGLLPNGELTSSELQRRFLSGRMTEIRMLFYVGKDLDRWIEQCVEMVERDEDLRRSGVAGGSFIKLLVDHAPKSVREKLGRWGVADYRSIFRRALGLNALFSECPSFEALTPGFIRYYYRYADHMYTCRLQTEESALLPPAQFPFELFASGEYARILERQWEEI
jgi:hypothetical protein